MGANMENVVREGNLIRCGDGTLERRKGIYIARLKGDYKEMGRQHGALASQVSGDLVATYFYELVEVLVKHSTPALSGVVGKFLKWLFFVKNRNRIGQPLLDHVEGFAEALGMSPADMQKVIVVPDILHYIIGKFFPTIVTSAPGCTGFMARGAATAGGKLLVGRNFDFFGQGLWDANNAVIIMEPSDGQKFCWFGALGAPASGQGMNENGLILSLHTKFQRDVQVSGIPLFTLVGDILQYCNNLEEAIAKIKMQPRICGLTLFIVDTKARDAATVGFSANHLEILRPENDFLVRANHYLTPEMKKLECLPHPWMLNSNSRFNRVTTLIKERHGKLEPKDIPLILSDCTDDFEDRKVIAGNIVAGANNSNSIAFSPDDDAIWIANGKFPVCLSETFEGFKISALFKGDRDNYEIADLQSTPQLDERQMAARRHYQAAWSEHLECFRDDLAAFHLRQAAELAPEEPIFPRMAGLIYLKEKKYKQALPLLEKNAAFDNKCEIMRAESYVWLARCLDLLDRHNEAIPHYKAAAALNTPPVSTAAARHINQPFTQKQLAGIAPEFCVGTAVAKF